VIIKKIEKNQIKKIIIKENEIKIIIKKIIRKKKRMISIRTIYLNKIIKIKLKKE